jgi:hypothetical protein
VSIFEYCSLIRNISQNLRVEFFDDVKLFMIQEKICAHNLVATYKSPMKHANKISSKSA